MSGPGDNFLPNGAPNPLPGGSNTYPISPTYQGMPPMAPTGFGAIPSPLVGGQQFITSAPFPGFYFLPPLPMPNVQASSMSFVVPPPSVPHVPSPPSYFYCC